MAEKDDSAHLHAIAFLLSYVSDADRPVLLRAAVSRLEKLRTVFNPDNVKADCIVELAPYLTVEQIVQVLRWVADFTHAGNRFKALAGLSKYISVAEAARYVTNFAEALDIASGRSPKINSFSSDNLSALFAFYTDTSDIDDIVLIVLPHLTRPALGIVLSFIMHQKDDLRRAAMLAKTFEYFSVKREQTTELMITLVHRILPLSEMVAIDLRKALLPVVSDGQFKFLFRLSVECANLDTRTELLRVLAPRLDKDQVELALARVNMINDHATVARVLARISTYMEPDLAKTIRVAALAELTKTREHLSEDTIGDIARCFLKEDVRTLYSYVRSLAPGERLNVLTLLAQGFPTEEQKQIYAEALEFISASEEIHQISSIVRNMVPYLSIEMSEEIFGAVKRITGDHQFVQVLTPLVPGLTRKTIDEAITIVDRLEIGEYGTKLNGYIALSNFDHQTKVVLSDKITDCFQRKSYFRLVEKVAEFLPPKWVDEILKQVNNFESAVERCGVVIALLPFVSLEEREETTAQALMAVRTALINPEPEYFENRIAAEVVRLFPLLKLGDKAEVIDLCKHIEWPHLRVSTYAKLLEHAEPELRTILIENMLSTTASSRYQLRGYDDIFQIAAPYMSVEQMGLMLLQFGAALPRLTRDTFLPTAISYCETIKASGEVEECKSIYTALQQVVSWYP
jgi:hypothetical protein